MCSWQAGLAIQPFAGDGSRSLASARFLHFPSHWSASSSFGLLLIFYGKLSIWQYAIRVILCAAPYCDGEALIFEVA
jgi:hypothetical protein